MNFSDANAGFVIAAYLVAFVVIAGMIIGTVADYRGLKRALARLAERAGDAPDARH
jgi:heme exporter protein CcmD